MVSTLSLLVGLLSLGAAVAQCGAGTAKLTFEVMFDSDPGQTSVDLVNYAGDTLDTITLPITPAANTLVSYSTCVSINTLYKIAVKDSAGNGMSGQGYVSIAINDRLIASISDFSSEAAYYLVADGDDCGNTETRAVVNIRFDGLPAETTWSITNAGTNVPVISQGIVGSDSVRTRNTAALANQFLYIDKCILPGNYAFSITDANGINSPGFYRLFNEYNLLAVGGSQSGTSSTSFIASDTPAPTAAPTKDICDDNQFEKFLDDTGVMQPCIWLLARPNKKELLCSATGDFKDNTPNARDVCEETCEVCTDDCVDNNNVHFPIDGKTGRNCEWVRVRVQFDDAFWRGMLCVPGNPAWENCKETCEDCPVSQAGSLSTPVKSIANTTEGPAPDV